MMGKPAGKTSAVSLSIEVPPYIGYCNAKRGATVVIRNAGEETLALDISLTGGEWFAAPFSARIEAPFSSTVKLNVPDCFNPVFLAENDSVCPVLLQARASSEGKEVARAEQKITLLPFDWWEGLSGDAERLAAFVRPRLSSCARTLAEAEKRQRNWKKSGAEEEREKARRLFAAVYAAVKDEQPLRAPTDCTAPLSAAREDVRGKNNLLELGVYVCACLEAAGLYPVLAVGKRAVGVGVWLYDTCFLDPVTDDCETVSSYAADAANDLCFFDAEDLYADRSVAFSPACRHFSQKLAKGEYEVFTDIRRCRLGGISPCPLRTEGVNGRELLSEEEMRDEAAPPTPDRGDALPVRGIPEGESWERRLIDLTGKNALLNFTAKNALHVAAGDADGLFSALSAGQLTLFADGEDRAPGEGDPPLREELFRIERGRGLLRIHCGEEPGELCARLLRRSREAEEETGAKILYFAFGFLRYADRGEKIAPLVLAPAEMTRIGSGGTYAVQCSSGEYFVNTTLIELLEQQFGMHLSAVKECGGNISSLIGAFRRALPHEKGWEIAEDAYLAVFSFQRFLLWNDLRKNMAEFRKNRIVSALAGGAWEQTLPKTAGEDEASPADVLLPLPADGSQYEAIALSRTGASFVLHGPPGTGKSQTIANIISNALFDGKRVLFVAEKRAALDVVKARLETIGIGDFCLSLYETKTDKAEIAARILRTLHLKREGEESGCSAAAAELYALREELAAPVSALHGKRKAGFSVYEAILGYLENRDAPDIFGVGSAFCETLTAEKLAQCREAILSASAAAAECGGVSASPFEGADLAEYSLSLRDRVVCACEALLAEIRHLRAYIGLCARFFGQRGERTDGKSIRALVRLVKELAAGKGAPYFSGADEGEFSLFFRANRRLDGALNYYFKHFRTVVRADGLAEWLGQGGNPRAGAARAAAKRLARVALHPLEEDDMPKYLQTLHSLHEEMRAVREHTNVSAHFRTRGGLDLKRREAFLSGLYALHDAGAEAFPDFDPEAFNAACIRAEGGCAQPVFGGFLRAAEDFFAARDAFFSALRCQDRTAADEDPNALSLRAGALLDNIDMLPNWCMYRATARRMGEIGLNFVAKALESGALGAKNVLAAFTKSVCKSFLEHELSSDPALSRLTAGTLAETAEKFRRGWERFTLLTRGRLRKALLSRLPEEGMYGGEVAALTRFQSGRNRSGGLRGLFVKIPSLLRAACPCMLMSPTAVAQYLQPQANAYDLVIFDEASQMTSAEAVGSLARARAAIVVGDPNQLPPTSFFRAESRTDTEDAESVLDDCLSFGMGSRSLLWHYRSRHESLIAFSNAMYYENRLCTFPSPDALDSRVELRLTDGRYERGGAKCNKKEGEALVREIVRRLSDPVLSKQSMGVVTFSGAQQELIERLLCKELAKNGLEEAAYAREEPIFVKNLENVQGDERDVILFSVCYGPDGGGHISLNFGPLNRAGGWRRLNVAVSRARERMLVFSSMTASAIDLNRTSSRGVAGLKAFLEFAASGRMPLRANAPRERHGIGRYLAKELKRYGYSCRTDVGSSAFKVDVAVQDADGSRFLLGILCDGETTFTVKERNMLQVQTLERGGWNVMRVNSVAFYNDPEREIGRIKDVLDRLTGTSRAGEWLRSLRRTYRAVRTEGAETASFVTGREHDAEIAARLRKIVAAEEPISRKFLIKRCLQTFGIRRAGSRAERVVSSLIDGCGFCTDRVAGVEYFYKDPRAIGFDRVRVEEGERVRCGEDDLTVYETVSLIRGALKSRVALYFDELVPLVSQVFKVHESAHFAEYVQKCVDYGEEKGFFSRSLSDRISLA